MRCGVHLQMGFIGEDPGLSGQADRQLVLHPWCNCCAPFHRDGGYLFAIDRIQTRFETVTQCRSRFGGRVARGVSRPSVTYLIKYEYTT
jgi:hypothetical protein